MSVKIKIVGLTLGALVFAAYKERNMPEVKNSFNVAGRVLENHLFNQKPAQLHSQHTLGYILGALNGAKEKAGLTANPSTRGYYLRTLTSVLHNRSRAQQLWDKILEAMEGESEEFFNGLEQGLSDYRARFSEQSLA